MEKLLNEWNYNSKNPTDVERKRTKHVQTITTEIYFDPEKPSTVFMNLTVKTFTYN